MRASNRMLRPELAAFAGLIALAFPPAGSAASITAVGTIQGSALSVGVAASPSFSANLDNGDATPAYNVSLATQDTRGTGSGWNETVTSTQFTTGAPGNYTLPTGASTVTGVSAANGTGTDTPPTDLITYPVSVPAGASTPPAVKIFNSSSGAGMGRFTITPTISVFIPQNSFGGTYTSTLTFAIVSGP